MSSSAVTTAQIVSTMKRGENGSISVSMGPPSDELAGHCRIRATEADYPAHAIALRGRGYDTAEGQSIPGTAADLSRLGQRFCGAKRRNATRSGKLAQLSSPAEPGDLVFQRRQCWNREAAAYGIARSSRAMTVRGVRGRTAHRSTNAFSIT